MSAVTPLALSITADNPCPYVLPATQPITICLVGCGGTGSHLAMSLARIAVHLRERGGPLLQLCFIDGDRVERANLGRQLFSPAKLGRNKATTLADRLNAALGLAIQAVPAMATAELLRELAPPYQAIGVLVGAVDGAMGRRALHQALAQQQWRLWLDVGNEHAWGTVLIGSATERQQLIGACALGGLCTALPAPSLSYPHLLDQQPLVKADACAPAMRDERQSLMVNQAMAAITGQYLYQLIVARQLTTFETALDLVSLTMRSTAITPGNLARAAGLSVEDITRLEKPTRTGERP
ncbi:MAG: PRTRC system ThiF family protein [Oscillochloridaceae bacterium umkhey_bin13]